MLAAWYWTWQDPAAVLLALGGLALALWLRRRAPSGCSGCHAGKEAPSSGVISARRLLRKL